MVATLYANVAENRRRYDVSPKILRLEPNINTWAVMLTNTLKDPTDAERIFWYDQAPPKRWTAINNGAGYADNATEFILDDASFIKAGDIIVISRTGEHIYVGSSNGTTTVSSCVRAFGTTAAAAINDNDEVLKLGNASAENSSAPATLGHQPTECVNYIQEVRTPFDGSMLANSIALRTNETERNRLAKDKFFEHRQDLEYFSLLGEFKSGSTTVAQTCAGIKSFIASNVYDVAGVLTESKLEAICEMAFKYGSPTKTAILNPTAFGAISQFAQGKLTTSVRDDVYGARISTYRSAHGDLDLIKSKALEEGYSDLGFILDTKNIKFRPLSGYDTKYDKDIQANDLHGWKDEYWTVFTMEVRQEKTHTLLSGITA